MGIRLRNLHNTNLTLHTHGVTTTGNTKDCTIIPFNGFISNIVALAPVPGTGSTNSKLDINYNGTNSTIFNTNTTQVTLAATSGVMTVGSLTTSPFAVTAGAMLTLDIDAAATGSANFFVQVTISKTPTVMTTLSDMGAVL